MGGCHLFRYDVLRRILQVRTGAMQPRRRDSARPIWRQSSLKPNRVAAEALNSHTSWRLVRLKQTFAACGLTSAMRDEIEITLIAPVGSTVRGYVVFQLVHRHERRHRSGSKRGRR